MGCTTARSHADRSGRKVLEKRTISTPVESAHLRQLVIFHLRAASDKAPAKCTARCPVPIPSCGVAHVTGKPCRAFARFLAPGQRLSSSRELAGESGALSQAPRCNRRRSCRGPSRIRLRMVRETVGRPVNQRRAFPAQPAETTSLVLGSPAGTCPKARADSNWREAE